MPELTYSKLIVFRITHKDPKELETVAAVFQDEVSKVFAEWVEAVPQPKPQLACITVGADDFPMRQVPS